MKIEHDVVPGVADLGARGSVFTQTTRRKMMTSAVASVAAIAAPSIAEANPDAELIALGREFLECVSARESTHNLDVADDVLFDLIEQIIATPSHSEAGLVVKARAAAYLQRRFNAPGTPDDIEDRMIRSILDGILAASGETPPVVPAALSGFSAG